MKTLMQTHRSTTIQHVVNLGALLLVCLLATWSVLSAVQNGIAAQDELLQQTLNGFFYGVLFIMSAYNLILSIYLKDSSYLYFALLLLTLMTSIMGWNNLAHEYLWPNLDRLNASVGQLSLILGLIFGLVFTRSFLMTSRYAPTLDKLLIVLMGVYAVLTPLLSLTIGLTVRPLLVLIAIAYVAIVAAAILVARRGYRPARDFLLAWLLLLAFTGFLVLSPPATMSLPAFSALGAPIAVVVVTLAFSLALAHRTRTIREQQTAAQIEDARETRESDLVADGRKRATREEKSALEASIEERTRELALAQAMLNTLFETSPLGIGFADADGQVLSANSAMAHMFGYTVEEFLQHKVVDFFPTPEQRAELLLEIGRDQTIRVTPIQLRRKDGSLFYATLTESKMDVGNEEVLLGVVDDITDRIQAEKLQKLVAERAAVAEERNRIARDLHDSVTQTLYTASLIAETLPAVLQSHPDEALQSLTELRQLTLGALAEMRTLLLELRPGELAERKLGELLRQLTDAMSARSSLPITTTVVGECSLPREVQIAFYRVAQEALNNVSKHARASIAHAYLICYPDDVTLRITDDGRGFDPESAQPHQMGLGIMRERIQAIEGTLTINSQPGRGTEVIACWKAHSGDGGNQSHV